MSARRARLVRRLAVPPPPDYVIESSVPLSRDDVDLARARLVECRRAGIPPILGPGFRVVKVERPPRSRSLGAQLGKL